MSCPLASTCEPMSALPTWPPESARGSPSQAQGDPTPPQSTQEARERTQPTSPSTTSFLADERPIFRV